MVRDHGAIARRGTGPAAGGDAKDWTQLVARGGFDHVERHDDRVQLFATRLGEGIHEFSYIVRATTAGTFRTAPARAEEMYEPEVFGRTATAVIEVQEGEDRQWNPLQPELPRSAARTIGSRKSRDWR